MAEDRTDTTGSVEAATPEPSAPPASPPGYELHDEIGRGGMGVVYRARDTALDRDVAVKLLAQRYPADSPAAQRFLSEARITGQLQHPGIPAVHQVGSLADGRPFLAMKLIKGSTLEAILKQRTDLSADRGRLLAVFEAVCQAVGYAHAHHVIHRDLKPANVMVGAFGEVQVMDWGLAKILGEQTPAPAETPAAEQTRAWTQVSPTPEVGSHTQAGTMLGTPAFAPPEQVGGEIEKVGTRADVFGLGAILAVLLTGKPPYVGETAESVRVQALRGKLDDCFARMDACGAEPELVVLCKQCLAFESADRPADAGAVAQAVAGLRAAADERARQAELERVRVEGEQATAAARSAERRKRRRLVIGAAAVLAVAVIGGLTAVLAVQRQANTELAAKNYALANETRAAEEATAEARRRSDAERWQRYRANIAAAASALQLQNTAAARRALQAAPEEHCDWEWMYFSSRLDDARTVLPAPGVLPTVTLHPDGKRLAAGSEDGTVWLWDTATGREVGVLRGQGPGVRELTFPPDGRRLLVLQLDGAIRSWDLVRNEAAVVSRIPADLVFGQVLSPDGRLVVGLEGRAGRLWDVATGRKVADLPGPFTKEQCAAAFFPDGRRLAYSTDDGVIHLWDVASGAEGRPLAGRSGRVRALAVSADGKRLASGAAYPDDTVRLWDVATGKGVVLRGHRNEVKAIAFRPDGSRLVSASLDQTARLWDGATGRLVATLKGHTGFVWHASFSPDGRRVVTTSEDGTLRLWDAADGEPVAVLRGHTGAVGAASGDWVASEWTAAFSGDGALLASASADGTVRLWDMALAERSGVLRGHTSYVYDVAFSLDGTRAASAAWDGTVRLWDPTSCLPIRTPLALPAGAAPYVIGVCFRPDGKQLASTSGDNQVRVWDAASGKVLRKLNCPIGDWRLYARAAFDPTGTMLAAGGNDGLIRLWGAEGDEPLATLAGHNETVGDVAFRPDGAQLASGGLDRTVRLWDVATRQPVAVLRGHGGIVTRVAYSADGRLLVSASVDKTVRLWDAATGEALAVLRHGSIVYGVAFNPRGTRLAAACGDNTIRLWDVGVARRAGGKEAPDAEVAELHGHDAYVHAVDWNPDGTRLISASGDGTVRVWDSLSAQERARSAPAAAAAPAPKSPGG
jgi:WD40 repeat protein